MKQLWQNWVSLVGRVYAVSPLPPATLAFLYALIVCSLSYPLGLASVPDAFTAPGTVKEVGYIPAINWSISYLVIFPLIIYFLFEAFECVPDSIKALGGRGMLVNSDLQVVDRNVVLQDWNDALRRSVLVTACLFILALLEPLLEWWATSGYPLIVGKLDVVAEHEFDWSVGALLTRANVFHRFSNGVFSLMVFGQQAMMIAVFALILVFTATFCVFFAKFRKSWQIIPDRSDKDPHKGFEIFEGTITHLLSAALLSLAILYASILQNYYLRTSFQSLFQFCQEDIVAGAMAVRSHTPNIPSLLGAVPTKLVGNPINFSVGQTRLGGLIVVLLILGVPLWILRGVAKRGAIAANYVGKIDYWPLSYISLNAYLLICALAGLSLIFYRVGLWIFGVLACALLSRCFASIYRRIVSDRNRKR
jgi:hypothetical protein